MQRRRERDCVSLRAWVFSRAAKRVCLHVSEREREREPERGNRRRERVKWVFLSDGTEVQLLLSRNAYTRRPQVSVLAIITLHHRHTSFCLQRRNNNYPTLTPNCSDPCVHLLQRETEREDRKCIYTPKWQQELEILKQLLKSEAQQLCVRQQRGF